METLEKRIERSSATATSLRLRSHVRPDRLWSIPSSWKDYESKADLERGLYVVRASGLGVAGFSPNCWAAFWRINVPVNDALELIDGTVESIPNLPDFDVIEMRTEPIVDAGRRGVLYYSIIDARFRGLVRTVTEVEVLDDPESEGCAILAQRASSVPVLMQSDGIPSLRSIDARTLFE